MVVMLCIAPDLQADVHWGREGVGTDTVSPETPPGDGTVADSGPLLSSLAPSFVENRGQLENAEVRFYAQGDPLSVGLAPDAVVFTLKGEGPGFGAAVALTAVLLSAAWSASGAGRRR